MTPNLRPIPRIVWVFTPQYIRLLSILVIVAAIILVLCFDIESLLSFRESCTGKFLFLSLYFFMLLVLVWETVSLRGKSNKLEKKKVTHYDENISGIRIFERMDYKAALTTIKNRSGIKNNLRIIFLFSATLVPLFLAFADSHESMYLSFKIFLGTTILIYFSIWLEYLISDYFFPVKKAIGYFYPSIIYTVLLVYVVAKQEQFSSLFLDLIVDPLNMFFFLLLFAVSLITVWMTPSYLYFTDFFYLGAKPSGRPRKMVFDRERLLNPNGKNDPGTTGTDHGETSTNVKSKKREWLNKVYLKVDEISSFIAKKVVRFPSSIVSRAYNPKVNEESPTRLRQKLYPLIWQHKDVMNWDDGEKKKWGEIQYAIEPLGFSFFRLLIGLAYLTMLSSVVFDTVQEAYCSYGESSYKLLEWLPYILLIVILIVPVVFEIRKSSHILGKLKPINKNIKEDIEIFSKRLSSSWKRQTILGVLSFAVTIIVACYFSFLDTPEKFPSSPLYVFLAAIIGLGYILIMMGYVNNITNGCIVQEAKDYDYQNRKNNKEKLEDLPDYKEMKKYHENFMTISLGVYFLVSVIAILVGIIGLLCPFSWLMPALEVANPINIFLLLINGFIAAFVILDRYLTIRRKAGEFKSETTDNSSGFRLHQRTARAWVIGLIILCVGIHFNRSGNIYHRVPYIAKKDIDKNIHEKALNLSAYVNTFLSEMGGDSTKPILCIAADGGGLKAAYWTMLVLLEIEKKAGNLDQVFMMSGASGGGIGEGIYTYLTALDLDVEQKESIIEEIGKTNFLSSDLMGVLTRWPMNHIPNIDTQIMKRQDRMEAMAEFYLEIIHNELERLGHPKDFDYASLRKKPYHYLWSKNDYKLPLLIVNTASVKDGVRGWVHPLVDSDSIFDAGHVDLTKVEKITGIDTSRSYISFTDALFLCNRFPLASPRAEIDGKGHFIDVGAVENSGLQAVLDLLLKMKATPEIADSTNFFDHDIQLLSIRNDQSRFIIDEFDEIVKGRLGTPYRVSEIGASIQTVASAGLTGKPRMLDQIADGEFKEIIGSDSLLIKISLPFKLNKDEIMATYGRRIEPDTCLRARIEMINDSISKRLPEGAVIVEPPLGRFLSGPDRVYMRSMLKYFKVEEKLEEVLKENN